MKKKIFGFVTKLFDRFSNSYDITELSDGHGFAIIIYMIPGDSLEKLIAFCNKNHYFFFVSAVEGYVKFFIYK